MSAIPSKAAIAWLTPTKYQRRPVCLRAFAGNGKVLIQHDGKDQMYCLSEDKCYLSMSLPEALTLFGQLAMAIRHAVNEREVLA